MGGWERSSPLLLFTADTHRSLSQFRLSKDRLSKDATEYSGFMFPWADTPLSRPHLRDAAPSRPAATEQPYLVKLLTGLRAQRQRDRRAVHYALDRYLAAKCNTYRGGRGPKGKTLLECVTQTGDDARSAQLGRLCRRDAALCRARIASGTHRRGRRRLRARASAHEGPGCWRHTLMLTSCDAWRRPSSIVRRVVASSRCASAGQQGNMLWRNIGAHLASDAGGHSRGAP